jgi:hypothetical protein
MKWWATLLWCALAAATTLAAMRFTDSARASPSARPGADAPLLAAALTDPDQVEEIRISRRQQPPLRLLRRGQAWVEVEPSGLPVDPFAVRELLAAARSLTPTRWISLTEPGGENLRRALELEPPEATVLLRGKENAALLRLGRLGLAGRAFIQPIDPEAPAPPPLVGREEVAVVGQELHSLVLQQDPAAWRLRSLFPDAGVESRRLEYSASGAALRLTRDGGGWRMEAPVATRVDPEALGAYLAGLARAECSGFLGAASSPEALEQHGLAPPAASLSLQSGVGPAAITRTLLVGRPTAVGATDRFGMLEGHPVLLALSQQTLQSLFASPAALIDPRACGVLPADVKRIRVKGPEGEFIVERDLDQWRALDGDGAELPARPEPGAVEEFLLRLTAARASSVSLRPIPPEMLLGQIDLLGFDGGLLAAIEVSADDSRSHFAFDAGDGVARVFPASAAPGLTKAALGLRAQ